jgi:nitrate reductase gamma subunit
VNAMAMIPYVLAYIALGAFVIAVLARFVMWSKMPMHLRWELYPVAHEGKKARYGGSYLEESEWWKKPREFSLTGEIRAMAAEILFLVALKENNPGLWRRSFPFHFGLYLVIGCTLLMGASGVLAAVLPAVANGSLGAMLQYAIAVIGVLGLCLGIAGALGLLHQRLTNPDLRDFTAGADIFNLVIFIIVFGFALLTFILVDGDFSRTTYFVQNLVNGNMRALPGSGMETVLPVVTVILMSLLVAYIPLTHMSHFVGKYFAYHSIRWNDKPNLPGGDEESTINDLLKQPVSWAAPHIKADGKKSWAEVAANIPLEERQK